MSEPLFTGVGVALATLFDEAGEVDAKATAGHAATLVELGVRAVVVAGSTGEAAALTSEERLDLLSEVRLARAARDAGADAVLALGPPRTTDPRPYYDAVAEAAGDLPSLAYHFPQTSPPGIPVEVLPDLPVQGMKDSSGEPERLLAELEVFHQPLYVGAAMILLMAGSLGVPGAILAVANVDPEHAIVAFAGDPAAQQALLPAHRKVRHAFPSGLKQAIADRFGTSPSTRLG